MVRAAWALILMAAASCAAKVSPSLKEAQLRTERLLGPRPGELPAGVYTSPPLARLPSGPVLWSTGQLAAGEGRTQVAGFGASYSRLARAGDDLVACGVKETSSGYFSGSTGRLSCVLHSRGGSSREVFSGRKKGERGFDDIVVRGATLVGVVGQEVWAIDLSDGRVIGRERYGGPTTRKVLLLPGVYTTTGPSFRSSPSVLLKTGEGVVHARLVDAGGGWTVLSQEIRWSKAAVELGPVLSAPAPPDVQDVANHDMTLASGGLDGRRILFAQGYQRRHGLIEFSAHDASVSLRWSDETPEIRSTDVRVATEEGLVALTFSASGGDQTYVFDLRNASPLAQPLELTAPSCAVSHVAGHPPTQLTNFITGDAGLEAVTEWSALPRCWTTRTVSPQSTPTAIGARQDPASAGRSTGGPGRLLGMGPIDAHASTLYVK